MFKECSREHSRLCFTEHGAKFQVPVTRLPVPTFFGTCHALTFPLGNAREATA